MEGFESKEEQLATVNEAIYKIMVGGQSYKIGTKQLTRADLNTLLQMQSQLRAELAASGDQNLFGDTVVAVFDGRY